MFFLKREKKGSKGFLSKLNLIWKSKKYRENKNLFFLETTSNIAKSFKLFIRLFLLFIMPILSLLLILFVVIIAVWQWFNPNFTNNLLITIPQNNMVGGFVEYVLQAICSVLYMIFIKPILLLLNGFQTIMIFLTNGALINKLLFGGKKILELPIAFFLTLSIAIGLLFIFISIKIVDIIAASGDKKIHKIKRSSHNLFISIIGVILIPIIFYLVNTLVTSILNLIIVNIMGTTQNIGLVIFNSCFNDGIHNVTEVPTDWKTFENINQFDFILCLVAETCICYMSFMMVILVVETSLIISFLFIVSPFVIFWSITDEGKRFFSWKEITIARFVSLFVIYLIYCLFITSVTIISELSTMLPKDIGILKCILNLVFMFTAFGAVLQSPKLVDSIMGGTTMADGMARILGVHNTTKNVLGTALIGSKKGRERREKKQGENATMLNTAGGVVGAGRGIGNYFKRSIKDLKKGV